MDAGRLRWSIVFVLDALSFCLDITAMLLVPTLLLHLRLFQSFSQDSVALREFLQSSSEPTILCRSTTVHHTIEVSSRVSKSEHICIHLPDHSLKNAQMSHTCWFYFFRLAVQMLALYMSKSVFSCSGQLDIEFVIVSNSLTFCFQHCRAASDTCDKDKNKYIDKDVGSDFWFRNLVTHLTVPDKLRNSYPES